MISDVLVEAVDQINEYLRAMPDTYADDLVEILQVMAVMDALRQKLDCPFSDAELVERGFVPLIVPDREDYAGGQK